MYWLLKSQGKSPWGWVGHRGGLDDFQKINFLPLPGIKPQFLSSSVQASDIPAMLFIPLYIEPLESHIFLVVIISVSIQLWI